MNFKIPLIRPLNTMYTPSIYILYAIFILFIIQLYKFLGHVLASNIPLGYL